MASTTSVLRHSWSLRRHGEFGGRFEFAGEALQNGDPDSIVFGSDYQFIEPFARGTGLIVRAVPIGEGLQLFSSLQRLGIPSRMINFPDEGHWVLKPANSAYWHKEVFAWLKKYVPPGGR